MRSTAGLLAISLIAFAGEWVSREDNGDRICRISGAIHTEAALADGFCTDWQITPIRKYQALPSEQHGWIRCIFGGCQIHIENKGWRP